MNKVKFPSQPLTTLTEIKNAIKSGATFAGGGLEVTEGTESIIEGKVQGIRYSGLREDQQSYNILSTFVSGDVTLKGGKVVNNVRAEISQKLLESLANDDTIKAYCTAQPYTKKGDEKTYFKLVVNSLDANIVIAKNEAIITEAIPV